MKKYERVLTALSWVFMGFTVPVIGFPLMFLPWALRSDGSGKETFTWNIFFEWVSVLLFFSFIVCILLLISFGIRKMLVIADDLDQIRKKMP
mgnify:CR=1 FL=1